MTPDETTPLRSRALRLRDGRLSDISDLGQTALVAVVAVSVIVALVGATLVATVVQSFPLQQAAAVTVYAHRALQAGENAYVTAVNANPTLAQCNTSTNKTGPCSGLDYGEWNLVSGSNTTDGAAEYYAFGNPQPTFDPKTHALSSLSVQVVGAAHAPHTTTNYVFQSENINLAAKNGFLTNVWWSNYESYTGTGNYSSCNYNWKINWNINGAGGNCGPVYFGPHDYLFGPVYTNDSVFVAGDGTVGGGPSFGNSAATPAAVPSLVGTADPKCLFVDGNNGMSGLSTPCTAQSDVALYDQANSSFGNPVQAPPQSDAQLGIIASQNGCLYSGPTQVTLSTDVNGVGQMTVVSPDTTESTVTVNGQPVTWDNNNIPTNYNNCPNNGTAPIPADGVLFVQNAKSAPVTGANPFDNYINNTVTNLTANPSTPTTNNPVTLTATVTSASNQISSAASVAFSQTTRSGGFNSTSVIPACSAVTNWSAPIAAGSNWTSTATCSTTEASNGTGAFSAAYSGGTYTGSSQANLGQTNTLTPSLSFGANSQTNAGGCSSCYYGESSAPDAEGDAFVNGSLSGQLTVGTANNVIIDGNLTYADCSGKWLTGQSGEPNSYCPYSTGGINDALGLIANNYVEVNHPVTNAGGSVLPSCGAAYGALCDPSNSAGGLTIDAAVLALTQSFVVNNYGNGSDEGQLNLYGSIQQFARGPVGTFNGNSTVSGYVKHYTWDPLLDFASPPSYLVPSTAPWVLSSINANGGEHQTTVCPALTGIYNGTGPGTPITQYCTGSPGGLPTYPAITVPSPPTNASATASIGGTATVTWTDPSDNGSPITQYDIIANPACTACAGTTVMGATATSATITGLTPGTAYVFMVTATNAYGTSDTSNPTPSVTAPSVPYAPTLVTAVGNINDTVTVNWTDPSSVGSPISKYTVIPSPACGSCTGLTILSATATATTIGGLTIGGSYTFTVTATNALGTGPPSVPSNPVIVPTQPGAPIGVSGTSYASGQSVVSWSPPASSGGLTITGYTVTSSNGRTCTTTGTPSCTVNGLTNGTAYTFTVTATNAIGTGPASAASPPATPSTLPGAPTIGTATNGVGAGIVAFTPPGSNGGAPITSYTATSSPGGLTGTCASSPCTVSGLTTGTTYRFKVSATNGSGTGPQSGSSNSITATGPPGVPNNVAATSYADTQSVVTWTAPSSGGSGITSYTVTSSGGQTCTTPNGTTLTCTVVGLTNGSTYTFTVTATNALGTGSPSAAATATPGTVPSAPTIGVATGAYRSATVTWSVPASNGGLPITGYTVTSTPGNITCSTSGTSCTVVGLTNGTSYTFNVTATNAAGTGAASAASNAVVPANTPPGAPTNVTATSFANTQSVVSWTAAASNGSAITHYTVTSSGGQTCTTPNGTTTNCTVVGLTNGTSYTFTVTATNGIGTGPASAPSSAATPSTVPGAPTGVVATANGNAQSAVWWTAPLSNGGAAITNYTVTSSPGNKTCTTSGISCTVLGLTNGTSYTFTVTATNGSGTGPASSASSPVIPATVPGAPTGVAATSNANTQSVVTWSAPASNGGAAISSYTVTSSGGQVCTTPNGTTLTCTVTGLTNGTAYTFTVAATNSAGTGPSSAASAPATPASLPGAPTGVIASNHFDSISVVSWTAPSDGGSPITSYKVTSAPGGFTCTTATTSCTVSGLTNGTTYTFTVTATNALGTGPASAPSAPIVPAATPGVPTGVTATSFADSQSVVSWTAPVSTGGSPIISYTVTVNTGQTCVTGNGSTTSCTILGLTNGTTYAFIVNATNAIGDGPTSAQVLATPSTVPTAPTGVTATSFANTQSVVSWTVPASNGGAAITGYTVTATDTTTPANGGQTATSSASPTTVPGLTNGDAYTFTVTATNGSGVGPASAPSAPATPATIPGAPTNVAGSSYANTQSVVSWTPPASNGGAPITNYKVISSPGGFTCSTVGFNCTVNGLTNGSSYTFTVVATNAVGSGPASAASLPATPATFPGAPTGAVALATNFSGTASVNWTPPSTNGGVPVTSYTVTSSPGGYTCTTANGSTTTCVFSGLTNGTTYTFTVTAANGAGSGPASPSSNPLTVGTPGVPSSVSVVSYQNTQVPVTWVASPTTGGSPITSYTATASPGGQSCTTPNGATTNCTVTGLTNGTAYTFTVTAANAVGSGNASVPSAPATPATAPSAPTAVVGTSYANTQSVVSWTTPASNGGAPITGYTVTASPGAATCTATTNSCTVVGLTNGTAYTFTVTATNAAGTSVASSPSAPATPATIPGAPTAVAAVSWTNAQSLVSWTAPASNGGAPITQYTVTSSPGGFVCTSATTSCTVNGLTNGSPYTFTVTATNGAGTGPASSASAPATPATVPTAPTAVTATSYANTQAVVAWTASSGNGGAAITGYTATASPGGQTCSAASTTCTVSGLTNGTAYTFTVTASNAAGTSAPSTPSAPATPATVPGAPTGVTASSYLSTQSVVSWTPPASNGGAAITSYKVTSSPGAFTCTTASTSCTVSGLTNGNSYTFTVTATNPAGTSAASSPSAPATPATVPTAPTAVTATSNANSLSVVSWTAPVGNGGAALTSYTATASPGGLTCTTANGTTTTCPVNGLTNGTAYTFTVTATNPAGTSAASSPSAPATPATVPTAPTAVVATSNANTQSVVSWTAPSSNGGAAISGYTVVSSPGGFTCSAAITNCTVGGLTNGSAYTFTVTATNSAGTGPASAASAPAIPAAVPSAPTGVTASSNASNQSVVSWTAPSSNGGATITGYTVTSSPGGFTCSTPTTSCTVNGLTNGTSYTFTVTAQNSAGTGPASLASSAAIPATAPGVPTGVTGTSYANAQSVVSWTAPVSNGGAAISSYTVTSFPGAFTCSTASTTCIVTGLTNGTSYTFTVTATNSAGTSSASSASPPATPATAPGTPTGVTATSNANTQSVVSWTAPLSNGGAAITSYAVTSSPGGFTCSTATTSCTVGGLTNGTSYTFTVKATNPAGTGTTSGASAPAVPATAPGAPTSVNASSYVNSQSLVSWNAPVSNGGAAVSSYAVTSTPGGFTCSSATTSCTVGGLTNGTSYTFTVTATNSAGTSVASTASAPATPATTPGAPTGVTATSNANTQSVVAWTAPLSNGGAPVTSYTVTSSPGGLTCSTGGTTCTVTGLTNGTPYTFTVQAINASGTGSASTASAPATPATTPGAPTGVTATSNANTQSVVAWTAPLSNGGATITSYTVTSSPGGFTCSSATTTCTVSGLTNGTPYTFTVTGTNSAGMGSASAASSPATPATTPGVPTAVNATSNANTQSVVSWTAPLSNGGAVISTYTVTSTPGAFTCSTATTSCTVGGLTNGTAYTFTVTATNSAGTSAASTASAPATPATTPSVPTAVTATSNANAQSAVSWTASASNGGAAISAYTATSSPGGFTCSTITTSCPVTGLTNGTSYTFTVTATNSAGTSAASSASAAAIPATTASAPTGVTASATSTATTAAVNWTTPASNGGAAITNYTVTSSPGALTCTTAATSCTVAGLTSGTAYTYTVAAINSAGTGAPSAASNSLVAGTPGAPTAVTATSNANAQSVVSWTAPAATGNGTITSYTATSSPGGFTCSSATTSCTVGGLTNGTSYTFTVTASTSFGAGPASAASVAAIPATTPGAPTAVTATSNANTQSVVSWTAPASNGGNAITGYTVTSSPGGFTCSTATTSCTVAGLTNGTSYTFTVTATNGVGAGSASAPSAAAIPATTPGAPTGVTAGAGTTTTSIAIAWTAPASNGGSALTGFTVASSPVVAPPAACSTSLTGASTNCVFTGLAANTPYTFTVTASNAVGPGTASTATAAVTTGRPGAPTAVTATATALATSATITWTAPTANGGSVLTGFTVASTPAVGPPAACTTPTLTGASTSCVFTGLTSGTPYTFTVLAKNANGNGPASAASPSITMGRPSPPTGVAAVATASPTSATINWTVPAFTGGSALTGFTVASSPVVAPPAACSTSLTGSSVTCVFTGLTTGTSYTFTVTAKNANGNGAVSAASNAIIVGTPGAPTAVSGTNGVSTQSTVSWTAPALNGGSAVTGYTVTSAPGAFTCTTATTSCTVTGLTNGTGYTFTVTAANSVGTGPSSAPSASITP